MFAPWIEMNNTRPVVKSGSHIATIEQTAFDFSQLDCVIDAGKVLAIDKSYWCGSCESYTVDFETMSCSHCGYSFV